MSDQNFQSPARGISALEGNNLGGLFVFFSFDLVNSTRYKNINVEQWPFVARRFYEAVVDGTAKWLEGCRVWKYVGDEVLLYKHIARRDQLSPCVENAAAIIHSVTAIIEHDFPDTRKLLGVKGTVWCARVGRFLSQHEPDQSRDPKPQPLNLVFRSSGGNDDQLDFLGRILILDFALRSTPCEAAWALVWKWLTFFICLVRIERDSSTD